MNYLYPFIVLKFCFLIKLQQGVVFLVLLTCETGFSYIYWGIFLLATLMDVPAGVKRTSKK